MIEYDFLSGDTLKEMYENLHKVVVDLCGSNETVTAGEEVCMMLVATAFHTDIFPRHAGCWYIKTGTNPGFDLVEDRSLRDEIKISNGKEVRVNNYPFKEK